MLIDAGADVNAQDRQRDSPFLLAGAEGRLDILKLAVAAGADLKSTNRYGGTALIPACHHGHVETVRFLLTTGIDVDHVNNLGWTALLEAVILGDGGAAYQEIVRMLIGARANPSIADRNGVTPLAHARQRGYRETVALLEAAGGNDCYSARPAPRSPGASVIRLSAPQDSRSRARLTSLTVHTSSA